MPASFFNHVQSDHTTLSFSPQNLIIAHLTPSASELNLAKFSDWSSLPKTLSGCGDSQSHAQAENIILAAPNCNKSIKIQLTLYSLQCQGWDLATSIMRFILEYETSGVIPPITHGTGKGMRINHGWAWEPEWEWTIGNRWDWDWKKHSRSSLLRIYRHRFCLDVFLHQQQSAGCVQCMTAVRQAAQAVLRFCAM